MSKIFLSVVIPSYNETANLKRGVLDEVNNYLKLQKYNWEVIISDDGSLEEESRSLAKDFCQKHANFIFLENEHGGKAFAVLTGIQKAQGEIVLFTDMDQSAPIAEIEKILPQFSEGFDIVIGSRGGSRKNFSPFRLLASAIFGEFRKLFVLGHIKDTQAGFKAFKGKVIKEIFPLLQIIKTPKDTKSGWKPTAFDVELMVAGEARRYKIAEVPILWEDRDVSTGKSRGMAKFIKESLEMIREVFRVKFNDVRGYYKK